MTAVIIWVIGYGITVGYCGKDSWKVFFNWPEVLGAQLKKDLGRLP